MSNYMFDRDQMNAEALKKIIGVVADYTEGNWHALEMTLRIARIVDEQLSILEEQSVTIPDAEVVTAACRKLYDAIGEPLREVVQDAHDGLRADMEFDLCVLDLWRLLAGLMDNEVTNVKKSPEALEAFMDWQEKILWSPPGLLSPNPEHVVYSIKIACKMVRECWDWNDHDIRQALMYADECIMKNFDDWDLEMLTAVVAEDWNMAKICEALDAKRQLVWADDEDIEEQYNPVPARFRAVD